MLSSQARSSPNSSALFELVGGAGVEEDDDDAGDSTLKIRLTATMADSLQRLLRSAPTYPGQLRAKIFKSKPASRLRPRTR